MKKKLTKTLSYIIIIVTVCASLSSCSPSTSEINSMLTTDPADITLEYVNLFEETVMKNGDTVRKLMLEFDENSSDNNDFPSFYSGSYLSYDSDENVNGMVFSLVDSPVSHEFADMVNSQKDIEYITFEYVRYSYNDLYELQGKVSDVMADAYSTGDLFSYISSCGIDMKNNCIYIEVIQLDDEKELQILEQFNDIFTETITKTQLPDISSDFDKSLSDLVVFINTEKRVQFGHGEYE